jgi:hypothetical protein
MTNPKVVSDMDMRRTLNIVKELALGKILKLPNGWEIAMGEDMSIGCVIYDAEGNATIGGLSTMDLKGLNRILTEHDIGMVIPNGRIRQEGY